MNIKKIEQGQILTRVIIEVMGSPKDYIENSLRLAIANIKENQEILKEEFFPAEEKDKMFSAFTELEILFKNTSSLVSFCFEYTPSSVEILEPQNMNYQSRDFANILNDLLGRLHNYAMVIKNSNAEKKILSRNSSILLQNLVINSLKEKDKDLNELSKDTGISEEKLKGFLEEYAIDNIIIKKEDKYAAKKD